MKITIPFSLGVLNVWAQGTEAAGSFLSLPMTRHTPSQALVRRQTDVSLYAVYRDQTYFIDVDIGTPKQRVQVAVDISLYDTMVMGKCEAQYYDADFCEKMGVYNMSLSTTGVYIAEDGFDEGLDDDEIISSSWARFQYYADDLTVAGQGTLKNVSFRVYKSSQLNKHGFLGLGFGESSAESPAFGILDGLTALDSGSLILGGVDTKKFSGALAKVPVVDAPQGAQSWEMSQYWMSVDGVTLDDGNGSRTAFDGFKVMAQSTTALSVLPIDIVVGVAEALGVRNLKVDNWYIVPCSRRDSIDAGSLELEFPGFTASIPYGDLLLPYNGPDGKEGDCYITAQPHHFTREFPVWLLGSTFLRSVYAVFDQDNKAVWLANYADCGSKPVAFSQGSDVRDECDGSSSEETSSGEGGSPDKDDGDIGGSSGTRMGVEMALMLGAALAPLIV